jgi:CheY-like chemotaxis protein
VANAIKFTLTGSIVVNAHLKKDMIHVSVKDTGIGIAKDMQERVFESFEQADNTMARRYGGTGIGLAITKQLVELHGGTIRVESELGAGAEFVFTLKPTEGEPVTLFETFDTVSTLVDNDNDNEIEEKVQDIPGEERPKILLVDDEVINLKVYKHQLKMQHYQIKTAKDGPETLKMLQESYQPDLILLDVMMARMNGYEVCMEIRKSNTAAELPIIMVSAKNQVKDLVYALESGANDFLSKPFSQEELLARIKTHLSLKDLADINAELNKKMKLKVEEEEQTKEL